MKHYAVYLRVSTQKQGKSGLGLDAQRKMCTDFIDAHDGVADKEFVDVESGTHRDRKGLQDAINYCKQNGCPLVIAKLDRLARDVEFCFRVVNTGIEIHFTDMLQMNTLLLGVFASVAQYERELTSSRTKAALAVKKRNGCLLGASNPTYKTNRAKKDKQQLKQENMKKGETKKLRWQQSRDTVAFLKIIKRVMPDHCEDEDPAKWIWQGINTRCGRRMQMLQMMRDFKDMDSEGKLFRNLDLSDIESERTGTRLCAMIQNVRRSFIGK